MDFIDDDAFERAQHRRRIAVGENKLERLRGGKQQMRRLGHLPLAP